MTADRDALIAFLRERDVMGDLVETVAEIIAERDELRGIIEAANTRNAELVAAGNEIADDLAAKYVWNVGHVKTWREVVRRGEGEPDA